MGLAEAASKSTNQFTTIVEGQVEPTAKMITDELQDLKQVEVLLETQRVLHNPGKVRIFEDIEAAWHIRGQNNILNSRPILLGSLVMQKVS